MILFENELKNHEIEYYTDLKNQTMLDIEIRYFIQDADRIKLDKIFIENEIIAQIETVSTSNYRDGKKTMKLYLKVGVFVFGIMMLIIIVEKLLK